MFFWVRPFALWRSHLKNEEPIHKLCVLLGRMYCPKCALQNGDEVIYCRGCGVDLASVRTTLEASERGVTVSSPKVQLSERQMRRMRRRGFDGTETPLTLAERAIEMQSAGVRGLFLSVGFAFITAVIYSRPPADGIIWLFPFAFTFLFFAASLSRFVQASMIKKLSGQTEQPARQLALPDKLPDHIKPPRSIYETDELAQPHSVTDATTRHLR